MRKLYETFLKNYKKIDLIALMVDDNKYYGKNILYRPI